MYLRELLIGINVHVYRGDNTSDCSIELPFEQDWTFIFLSHETVIWFGRWELARCYNTLTHRTLRIEYLCHCDMSNIGYVIIFTGCK